MPIDPNSIAWDSSPKVAPPAHANIAWDDGPAAPAAKPGYYNDGSYDYHNQSGILGWLQAADRMSARGADRLVSGAERFGQGVAQNIGLPEGVANYLGSHAQALEQGAASPVPGAVTWDDVKANPGIGNVASYIGQTALGATPDLAAVAVAPWLYAASREGDIAHTRAANNGHGEQIGLGDMAAAAPTAAIDTGLMKYGLGGILGGEGYGIIKGTARAAARDAIMGAGQPVVDQIGERLGTNKAIDWNEAGDQALAGAVGLAPFGAAAHLGVRGVRAMGKSEEPGPSPERPQAVRDQLTPEQADALTLHGIDVDTLEDAHMARKAADRLLAKGAPTSDAPPVIATAHGNVAPNADEHGRRFETIDRNGGTERQKFESKVIGAESGGDDNAKNSRSSASGRAQFTDDTFVRTYQKRFGTGESRESILAKKNDPRLQTVLLRDLTNSNEDILRRSGVDLTSGNYYLAHFAGAGGAVKLNRNLDAPVERILGQKAVDANPFLAGMTGRDVVAWAQGKMDGKASPADHDRAGLGSTFPTTGGHMVDYPARPSERGEEATYRAPDHSNVESTEPYGFDPIERGQRPGKAGAHDTGNMGEGDGGGRRSFTQEELNQPGAKGDGMATGGMGRPFKADPNTGQFEDVQRERVAQAEAEVEKRWQRRKEEAERMKAEFEARRNRAGQSDASAKYQQFGSKPHYDSERGHFRTTDDGFVADEGGNPVVWPTQGAAAKWAARFKMGGDFELQAHGTSAKGGEQPVTLQRKPNSTYGQEAAPKAEPQQGPVPQLEHVQWDEQPQKEEPRSEEAGEPPVAEPAEGEGAPASAKLKPVGPDGDGVYRGQIAREARTDAPAGQPRERKTIGEIHNNAVASGRAKAFEYKPRESSQTLGEISEGKKVEDTGQEFDVRDTGGGTEGNLENTITRERIKDSAPRLTREQATAAKTARADFNDAVTAAKADAALDPNPKEHTTVELKTARGHVTHYQVERTPEALDRLHERVNKLQDHAFYSRDFEQDAATGEPHDHPRTVGPGYDVFRDLPRNSIPEGVLKDGMEADRAFNWIAENSKDEFHRQLANTLVDLTEGVKINLYDRASKAHVEYGDVLRTAHGAVIHKGGQARIFLNTGKFSRGLTEETLLHEGIHAALATRVGAFRGVDGRDVDAARGFGQDVRRIKVLQGYVLDHIRMLDRTGKYREKNFAYETMKAAETAANNVDEFLTYALTDKEFQRMLQDIQLPDVYGETARLTAWQHFVNIVRRMVRLDPKYKAPFEKLLDADNALNSTIDTANEHFDRLAETDAHKQSDEAYNEQFDGGVLMHRDERRSGQDRREFGRAPRDTELDRRSNPDRRQLRASDAGVETAGDRAERVRGDNERRRTESRTNRVVAGAKALLNDERGSLDLDKVAKFFVDLDTMKEARDGIKRMAADLRSSTPKEVLAKTLDNSRMAGRFVASYFHTMDARLRGLSARFDSPTIRELADMFHARAGHADGTGQTYHEAVHNNSRRWNKVLFDTLHPFAGDAAAMERIRNIITKTGTGTVDERAAAARVAKLLKEIHDYRLDAGEDIGEVTDGYFPRALDPNVVVKHEAEFKSKAEALFIRSGDTPKDAKAKAEAWFHSVVNENAGLDGSILDVRRAKAPGTTSGLPRKLHKDADAVLAKFYQKDALDVLSAYITGSAKRAEFTRRFGVPGRDGSPERTAWQSANGHKDQLDVIRKKIDDEILASGKEPGDAQQLINDILEGNLGILGKGGAAMRTSVSMLHAYNQVAKMDHSLITSFNELAMGFVRGGPKHGLDYLATTVKEFGREIMKLPPSEARRYAEHLGLILNPMMDQVLQSRISAVESSKGVNKLVSRFYKVIGLHQFTEAERVAAAKMGREMIHALVGDLDSSNARTARRAERALAELGITDHAALKTWLNARSGKVTFGEIDGNAGMAAKWSNAVARLTNQTVMEPTRAVKPLWANHPLGSLLYGLMSYTFAFKKNVLDRVGALAIDGAKHRDPHQFIPLLFGMPILAAFTYMNDTYLRPALFGSSYDFAHETPFVAALRTADRASMLGAVSPFTNAMFGTKYTRSLSEAFMGSVAGSASQLAEKMVVKPVQAAYNGTEGNGAERGAAGALYDMFIEPAFDAAMVGGVGGKVATGAVYASGSRPGSIFPQDREAFIDAMAGELEDGGSKKPFGHNAGPFKKHSKAFGKAF